MNQEQVELWRRLQRRLAGSMVRRRRPPRGLERPWLHVYTQVGPYTPDGRAWVRTYLDGVRATPWRLVPLGEVCTVAAAATEALAEGRRP